MTQFILFAPLLAAIVAGFGWRVIGEQAAQYVTTGILFLACFLAWIIFLTFGGETQLVPVLEVGSAVGRGAGSRPVNGAGMFEGPRFVVTL